MNTHWTDRLSDYLDDELTPAERAACDAHLHACGACRATLAELRTVVDVASHELDREPDADLWPAILQQISTPQPHVLPFVATDAGAARTSRQVVFTLPQLALAASLLIAVSAAVGYLATGRHATGPVQHEDAIQAYAEPLMPASADVARADFADAHYDEAISDLEQVLVAMRDELNPQTVMVIERNLAAIDAAISEARAALDADPANTFLNSHLADARRKKLDLLRRATMIHSTSGD